MYTLLISVPSGLSLKVGKLGRVRLKKGIYIYTGSALGPGGLEKRLRRHLGRKKKRFWHVDYLLASGNAHVKAIAFAPTYGRAECRLNKSLSKSLSVPIKGFGSSDCDNSCASHLLLYDGRSQARLLELVRDSYRRCGLDVAFLKW